MEQKNKKFIPSDLRTTKAAKCIHLRIPKSGVCNVDKFLAAYHLPASCLTDQKKISPIVAASGHNLPRTQLDSLHCKSISRLMGYRRISLQGENI